MREISKYDEMSPVMRGRSRSRSRMARRVGSARARQIVPSTWSALASSPTPFPQHVALSLHICDGANKRAGDGHRQVLRVGDGAPSNPGVEADSWRLRVLHRARSRTVVSRRAADGDQRGNQRDSSNGDRRAAAVDLKIDVHHSRDRSSFWGGSAALRASHVGCSGHAPSMGGLGWRPGPTMSSPIARAC